MVAPSSQPATVNLGCTKLQLRDDLRFSPQPSRGKTYFRVESPAKAQFYRIGYEEYVLISLLDGQTSFAEALALSAQRLGQSALSTQQATTIYLWLLENDLGRLVDGSLHDQADSSRRGGKGKAASFLNPFWMRIPLGNPDRLLRVCLPAVSWFFSPLATLLGTVLIAFAAMTVAWNWERFLADADQVFSPGNWLWMGGCWIALKVVHELAHAFACRRYGGEVSQMGLVLVLFAPLAYVDVTSSWRFPSKWSRMHVAAAGIYVELLVAAVAALLWSQVDSRTSAHLLYNLVFMASVSTLLFNANPLMKFDGYFILSDLLELPNLAAEGSQGVKRHLSRFFLGSLSSPPRTHGKLSWWVDAYGWAALLWRIVVCASLIIAASVIFHGAGIVLAAFAMFAWAGKPLWKIACQLRNLSDTNPWQAGRALGLSLAMGLGAGVVAFGVPSPATVSAPGIVEYEDVEHLRSLTGGFVREIKVENGQQVSAGELLLVLENPQVVDLCQDLKLAVAQAELRYQVAAERHETSVAQVVQRELVALSEQLAEANRRSQALHVQAPRAGKVIRRELSQLLGTYIQEGDALLSIGNESSKELQVSIDHRDFDSVVPRVGKQVQIRIGSQARFAGTLTRLEPRASSRLIHAALSAAEGGSLAVVESPVKDRQGKAQTELTEPRFRAVISIPAADAASIFSGQRAWAAIGLRNESLGVTFYQSIRDWIENKLALARN